MHIEDFKGKTVHLVGIGGVSMRGLAMMLKAAGYRVTGSDQSESSALDQLREIGICCMVGHHPESVDRAGLVVRSAAISDADPEIRRARESGVPVMERGVLLGQIMQYYQNVLCISGTHGKTTTSSMISTVLKLAGKDPTIHLGGTLPLIGSTCYVGGTDYFVAEACEYKDSFLNFFPTCAIILNIDADHLDYFPDLDAIEASFTRFVRRTPASGFALGNGDDPRVCRVLSQAPCTTETFGYGPKNDWQATNISQERGLHRFTLLHRGEAAAQVSLRVMGRHNVMNASAAIAACFHAGVDPQQAADLLQSFTGAERRFERAGSYHGAEIFHDYAHHPTEIRATLSAARLLAQKRLCCVFQPHTYSRTLALFDEFVASFDEVDRLLLLDIYAAREADPGTVSSRMLADAIARRGKAQVEYAPSFEAAADIVRRWAEPGDTVMTLGAGDIEAMSRLLIRE